MNKIIISLLISLNLLYCTTQSSFINLRDTISFNDFSTLVSSVQRPARPYWSSSRTITYPTLTHLYPVRLQENIVYEIELVELNLNGSSSEAITMNLFIDSAYDLTILDSSRPNGVLLYVSKTSLYNVYVNSRFTSINNSNNLDPNVLSLLSEKLSVLYSIDIEIPNCIQSYQLGIVPLCKL